MLTPIPEPKTLLLASKSPRRKALLSQLGFHVEVIASHAHTLRAFEGDEDVLENEAPAVYVERIAKQKFIEGLLRREELGLRASIPVIAADTVVSLEQTILGKPKDLEEATAFLNALSGRVHDVRTAVVMGTSRDTMKVAVNHSRVSFKPLTQVEIQAYCQTDEPYDKAGGYGIQGLAGVFIDRIEGSYTGIMGLPLFETSELLREMGFPVLSQNEAP